MGAFADIIRTKTAKMGVVADLLDALNDARSHKAFMQQITTGQTIPNDTNTLVTFNNTLYDVGSLADLANNRFTIQRNGIYGEAALLRCPSMPADSFQLLDVELGGSVVSRDYRTTGSTKPIYNLVIASFEATAGQHVTLRVQQDSGVDKTTGTTASQRTRFWIWEKRQ